MPDRPGLVGFRISPTQSAGLEWSRLDEAWAAAGQEESFSAGWTSDHLSDASRERGGPAFESFTLAAALARRVPGKWVGIAVASATFRHPAVTAKAATVLDNVTGGRFILGLGAGWHAGEHDAYAIPLPPIRERFDRFESAVRVISALFSPAAAGPDGVSLDDPYWPLRGATNLPAPVSADGPPIWLGVLRPRGRALAARFAQGWPMPGNRPGDVEFFTEQRDRLRAALEAADRDPDDFDYAAQIATRPSEGPLDDARETALRFMRVGATHVILGLPATDGPEGVRRLATEVAEPILERSGR